MSRIERGNAGQLRGDRAFSDQLARSVQSGAVIWSCSPELGSDAEDGAAAPSDIGRRSPQVPRPLLGRRENAGRVHHLGDRPPALAGGAKRDDASAAGRAVRVPRLTRPGEVLAQAHREPANGRGGPARLRQALPLAVVAVLGRREHTSFVQPFGDLSRPDPYRPRACDMAPPDRRSALGGLAGLEGVRRCGKQKRLKVLLRPAAPTRIEADQLAPRLALGRDAQAIEVAGCPVESATAVEAGSTVSRTIRGAAYPAGRNGPGRPLCRCPGPSRQPEIRAACADKVRHQQYLPPAGSAARRACRRRGRPPAGPAARRARYQRTRPWSRNSCSGSPPRLSRRPNSNAASAFAADSSLSPSRYARCPSPDSAARNGVHSPAFS